MLDYFSLTLAILFTIYAADLLFLVVVSAFARRAEEKSGVSMSKPNVPGARYHRPDSPSWATHATHKDELRGQADTVDLRDTLRVDGYGDSSRWPKVLIQLPMVCSDRTTLTYLTTSLTQTVSFPCSTTKRTAVI
jgi:hypothetical protein